MSEIKAKDNIENNSMESNRFKEIKPEHGMTFEKAKQFCKDLFSQKNDVKNDKEVKGGEFPDSQELFTTREERVKKTPTERENGNWEGERGDSKFKPDENSETGSKMKERLEQYGIDGIEYKDGVVDFSKVADTTVSIENMTGDRKKNFNQADKKCAEQWNSEAREGKTDWSERDVKEWRKDNHYSWHERSDMKNMDLVSSDIHQFFSHTGGHMECEIRDAEIGGDKNGEI